jgi:hypothetical protein
LLDEHIIDKLIAYGYPREAVVQYLNKNELNSATTSYWLVQMAEKAAADDLKIEATLDRRGSTSQPKQKSALRVHSGEH